MKKQVLCFGSLNIDYTYNVDHIVQRGETELAESVEKYPGGKGLNQSIALAKSGTSVFHSGAVGEDGDFLIDILNDAGVNTQNIYRLNDAKTGTAIIQKDKSGDGSIILYGGANQRITSAMIKKTLSQFSKGDYLLLQNEINRLDEILEIAHAMDMKIVFNPSPLNEKVFQLPLEYVNVMMLNEVEGSQLLHEELKEGFSPSKMAHNLHQKYPKVKIVLTLGENGCIYIDNNVELFQPAYSVDVVDTTAAGDTFTGFFIGSIIEGKPAFEAIKIAAKAAAIAVTREGASTSIPHRKELE